MLISKKLKSKKFLINSFLGIKNTTLLYNHKEYIEQINILKPTKKSGKKINTLYLPIKLSNSQTKLLVKGILILPKVKKKNTIESNGIVCTIPL